MGALLLGGAVGYLIERRLRLAHLKHINAPPAAATVASATFPPSPAAPPSAALHPWTLEFADADLEAQYVCDRFVATYVPLVLFFGASAWLLAVAYPASLAENAVLVACLSIILGARVLMHRHADQLRARLLFGRACVGMVTFGWMCYIPWRHVHPPELSSAAFVPAMAVTWCVFPIYLRYAGFHYSHRLLDLVVFGAGVAAQPTFSELGRPAEPACLVGALLLGEAIGHALESGARRAHLIAALLATARRADAGGHAEISASEVSAPALPLDIAAGSRLDLSR